jgi:type VI secretion system protein ImpM
MSLVLEVGFYGKLPSHGDFLRRRVSDAFVGVWDGWLQECLTASRTSLGDRWLDVYLTSPVWRFACAKGICGPAPVIGVMVPSVDRVGRYFPLTLVAELPPETPQLLTAVVRAQPFFDGAERLVIETLESEHIDFESFDEQLIRLGAAIDSVAPNVVLDSASSPILDDGAEGWQIPIGSTADLNETFTQLMSERLTALYDPLALWWTEGSAIVQPSALLVRGLPHPDSFAALLDGSTVAFHPRAHRNAGAADRTAGGGPRAASLPVCRGERRRTGSPDQPGFVPRANRRRDLGGR